MHALMRNAVAAGLMLCAAQAGAENADTGIYFGVGTGAANYSDNIPRQIAAAYRASNGAYDLLYARTLDNVDTAAQVFVGYRVLSWLGAEVGYQDLGNARTFYGLHSNQAGFDLVPALLTGEYRARDFNAALVASVPVGNWLELLARAGVADTRLNYDEHGNDAGGNPYSFHAHTRSDINAQAGVGALWKFTPWLALRLDLDRNFDVGKKFALTPTGNGRFDYVDAYTMNLIWKP